MITISDLDTAIAECQGQPNPNANTCIKLASYLIIKKYMLDEQNRKPDQTINQTGNFFDSESEFWKKIKSKPISETLGLFDEVMTTIQVINPPMYASILRKI